MAQNYILLSKTLMLLGNRPTHNRALLRAKPITGSRKATTLTAPISVVNNTNVFNHIHVVLDLSFYSFEIIKNVIDNH